ncbi:MAG: Dabb family protein [Synergistaceae bacterium]|nr:Dabb family protein [Synergistaceae bacterium]
MLRHIVMWKLKDFAEGHTKDENKEIIKNNLEGLVGKIEGLLDLEVGKNFNPNGFDICLNSRFKDKDALAFYIDHPLHKQNQKYVKSVTCERAVADYEI